MFKPTLQCKSSRARGTTLRGAALAAAAVLLAAVPLVTLSATDLSSVPLPTYTVGSSVDVKPNIMMVLDDSGSMDWDYLPDWVNDTPANYLVPTPGMGGDTWSVDGTNFSPREPHVPGYSLLFNSQRFPFGVPQFLYYNASFNGVAYNPAVTYSPPLTFTSAGRLDTTSYPSMTASATSNFTAVPNDGYKVQFPWTNPLASGTHGTATSTSNLVDNRNSYFYTTVPGEYCDSPALTNCQAITAPSGKFAYPAPLRWCSNQSLTTCRGLYGSGFVYPRMAWPRIATLKITGSNSSSGINGITVDTKQIMSAGTGTNSNTGTLASAVVAKINACTYALPAAPTNCTAVGYFAVLTGTSTVTIYAPGTPSAAPTLSAAGSGLAYTLSTFDRATVPHLDYMATSTSTRSTAVVPGDNLRTTLTSSVTSYVYPGTATRAPTRTDCAGTSSCTYQEEMTNYANWWAYYRTRMQMMKTSTSRAFATLDSNDDISRGTSRYRIGYMSINNNTSSDFANVTDFGSTQKFTWYSKLLAAVPRNGTPLRAALSTAGRLYAGVLNGRTLNGSTVTDPMQFSCQKNYTILSTDGYWNGSGGVKLDGSSMDAVNIDGALPRPYNDGGSATQQTRTSTLQKRTFTLQKRTSSNKGQTWSAWSGTSSCTPDSSGTSQTQCRNLNDSGFVGAATCTAQPADNNGNTVQCQYTNWTAWSNTSTCTAVAQSVGPAYNVGTARQCQPSVTGGTSGTLADVAAYYYMTDLRDPDATGADATGTCTGPIISPATTPTDLCANNGIPAGRDNITQQHMTTHTLGLGAQGKMVYSPYQNDSSGQRVFVQDYWLQPSGDFFAVANGSVVNTASGVCPWMTSGTCTWPTPASDDPANIDDLWHAAVNGHGTYFSAQDPASLATALTSVLNQIVNVPRPGTAAAAASSNPNITSSDNFVFSSSYKSVDWFGELIMQQFNPDGSLTAQQWSAMRLLDCATTPWSAGKAFTQGQTYNQGGFCYLVNSDYTTPSTFDASTTDTQNTLKLRGTPFTRTIYTVGTVAPSTTNVLIPFTYSSLSTAQKAYFQTPWISYVSASQGLTQFCTVGGSCLSTANQTAASGQALVDFLRGDRSNETTYFHQRAHILGDIVSSEARYVKAPVQNYLDAGYAGFKTAQAGRAATVYVGSNDGMLHAFDALSGQERWAFIPSAVLPDLYRLADSDYANKHHYYVDGTPEVNDICPSAPTTACAAADWKTIIVGGLNQGGKSFYALDITDPATPRLMWEFTDPNLGFTYSNPRIAKLRNGTWVVMVATGYNSTDGVGRLYVINASTGALIRTVATSAGTAANPSGLTKLAARSTAAASGNNTVDQVYGGDLLGNLWRFDVNDTIAPSGYEAQLMINLQDSTGAAQPITAKPTAASTPTGDPLVLVGTGRYLGLGDLADTTVKYTMYAVKDKLDTTTLTTPRTAGSNFVQQTMVEQTCPTTAPSTICTQGQTVRTATTLPVDWSTKNGWYTDFVLAGERSVTDATLALGTLVFTTIKPQSTSVSTIVGCNGSDPGTNAKSYLYYLDYLTGGAVADTNNVVGEELCTCIATRPSVVKAQNGSVEGIIRTSGGTSAIGGGDTAGGEGASTDMGYTTRQDLPYSGKGGPTRRISWRELNDSN